jgi:DNA modification methylase
MVELMHGDCLELMKLIPDGSIDAIITDPPYGTTKCSWDSVIPFDLMWEQLNRIIKPNGAIVLFGSEPFSSALRMSNIKNYKYDWVYGKTKSSNFMLAKKQPLKTHENILIFYKKKPTYNPQMTDAVYLDSRKKEKEYIHKEGSVNEGSKSFRKIESGKRYPISSLLFNNSDKTKNVHPTQKPIALMEYLIKTYTNEGETVLDFTCGSGSTLVACQNTNRNGIGIEMDDKYFEIAKTRTGWSN